MPMVSIKQDLYVKIVRDSEKADTDVAGLIDRTLRKALKIKPIEGEPRNEKK